MEDTGEERLLDAAEEQARAEEVAAALSTLFLSAWENNQEQALEAIQASLRQGDGDVGEDDIQRVVGELKPFLSRNMVREVSEGIGQGVEAAFTIGGEDISAQAVVSTNVKDRQLKNFLSDNATFWVGNHYDQQVQSRIQEAADNVLSTEDGTLGRRKAAEKFKEAFQGEIQKSNSYWRLLANDVTTKSREFGRVQGMVKAGIEEYRIDAVLDRRTTDICRFLDGTTFQVEDAVEQRDRLLESDDPEMIKEISPWLDADVITSMSVDELSQRGILLPPFHGNCRTRIQAI
jgi:SPP1 gp7 family putative phage head morphogenesis protein